MSAEAVAESIPPGYKQTEVGVIPEDWSTTSLENATLKGGLVRGPFGGALKKEIFVESGYKVYEQRNAIYATTEIGSYFIDSNKYKELERFSVLPGDLIVSCSGTIGSIYQIPAGSPGGVINQALLKISLNRSIVKDAFFLVVFKSESFQERIKENSHGGAMQNLVGMDIFRKTTFQLPPLPEQEAIATALSDTDALIDSLEQLIAKKRQIKQGAMQELLQPKEGWNLTTIGDIADPNLRWSFTGGPFGSNLKSSDYTDDGIRIIQLQNIGDGEFKNEYEVYTSTQKADELLSCNIYPEEIILSKMGDPVARACIIPTYHERYLMCSDGIRLAIDQKRFNTYFIYTLINAPEFRMKAANAGTGSTRKRIGLNELRNLEILCPPLSEQTAIATILSDMDAEITSLEEKLVKTRQIKQGMMQELLTGRIRLV